VTEANFKAARQEFGRVGIWLTRSAAADDGDKFSALKSMAALKK